METLRIYVPMDRRVALSEGATLPDRMQGAVVFADISGFTPLTAALVQELGQRLGAEELIRQVNLVYDALIAQVHQYRGSVTNFSGDAITCWFDEDDGRRAVTCALAMQQAMKQFGTVVTPAKAGISIEIKVAIAAGPIRRFLVGDPEITLIEVLAGATVKRMAAAESVATKGEIVVSAEVVAANQDDLVIGEWRSHAASGQRFATLSRLKNPLPAAPWPAFDQFQLLSEEQVRPWLLPAVYEKLRMGQGRFVAELRPVVPLFLNFSDLDYDGDDSAGEKLDAFVQWVQRVLTRYEGTLLQITIGDKGSYLYAVFGALLAHEDDAARAVMAAMQLSSPPAELSYIAGTQIGISRGQMRVGPYGGRNRRAYGAIGHEANMAARLMSQAQAGQILVSQRVADDANRRTAFQFDYLGPVAVKGFAKPIPTYQVSGRQRLAQPRTRAQALAGFDSPEVAGQVYDSMLGRKSEFQHLVRRLEKLATGESHLMLIEGEAGIGKSRLVEKLLLETQRLSVSHFVGAGSSVEQSSPYYVWRAIFSQLFQVESVPDNVEAQRGHVLSQLPKDPELVRLRPLLNDVLPLDLPENELTQAMSGQARAYKTHQLLLAILQQVASARPLLLVLEDAHWQDSASWALTEAVSQQVRPLLLVIVTRPLAIDQSPAAGDDSAIPVEYVAWLNEAAADRLQLKALAPADTFQLICQRLGVHSLPEPVSDFIWERAEGHPFFSEELAYALRDAGLITISQGTCQLAPGSGELSHLDFPNTIEGVITSRFDQLMPQQQLVLKVSSVIGRLFAFRILCDIHPVEGDRPELHRHLDELEKRDITLVDSPEPELAYIFRHAITQQVAYNLLLYSHRRDLHRRVAEWYEHTYADDLSSIYPLLAYHWQKVLDVPHSEPETVSRALYYLEKAGQQALRTYANQEAVRFFGEALKVAEQLLAGQDESNLSAFLVELIPRQRRAHWELQLGEAYLRLGQMHESRRRLERSLALRGWPVVAGSRKMAFGLIGQLVQRILPKRVTTSSQLRQELLEAAQAYEKLVQIYYLTNQSLPTIYAMFRGLNLAERAGHSPELARAYANASGAWALVPMHGRSRVAERQARQSVATLNDPATLAYVTFITVVHRINLGDWEAAASGFTKALALARQLGDQRIAGICLSGLAHVAMYRGQFRDSADLFQELERLSESSKNVEHQATALSGQVWRLLHWGQTEEAVAMLEKGAPIAVRSGIRLTEINFHGLLAIAYLRLNRIESALNMAQLVFEQIQQATTSFAGIGFYTNLLEVYLSCWEQQLITAETLPQIKANAGIACKGFGRYARVFPLAQARAYLFEGRLAWLSGRPAQATKAWEKALQAAGRLSMPYEEGLAYYYIGRNLPVDHPRRQEYLTQAIDILTRLEACYDAELARAALEPMPSDALPMISMGR